MDAFNKLVSLNSEKIKTYLKNLRGDQLGSSDILNQTLDLAKEFRSRDYPLIHLLLQNPLSELISMAVPNPSQEVSNMSHDNIPGFLYLFDGRVPIERRRADEIQWNDSKKMSVKLIIYNENTGLYKLKNNKNDEGAVVMRRQTWRADGADKGWRRNEYKLVVKETYFKQAQDGRLSVTEGQSLQEFPVLVHYFWKKDTFREAGGHPRKKRKRDGAKSISREHTPSPTHRNLASDPDPSSHYEHPRRRGEETDREEEDNIEEIEGPDLKNFLHPHHHQSSSSSSSSSTSTSPSLSTQLSPRHQPQHQSKQHRQQSMRGQSSSQASSSASTSSSSSTSSSASTSSSTSSSSTSTSSSSTSLCSPLTGGPLSLSTSLCSPLTGGPLSLSLSSSGGSGSGSGSGSGGSNDMGELSSSLSEQAISLLSPLGPRLSLSSPALRFPIKTEQLDASDDLSIMPSDFLHFTSRVQNGALVPFTPVATGAETPPPKAAEIRSYAPESGPSTEYTKMLLVFSGFNMDPSKKYRFSCLFEEVAIPATEIAPGVIQCQVPPHKPGIVYFWLACVEEGGREGEDDDPKNFKVEVGVSRAAATDGGVLDMQPPDAEAVQYSQPVPFYYTPNEAPCRLSLAWELVGQNDLPSVMRHFKYATRELDLSNNNLTNVDFLEGFKELHTLILDNNHITHDVKFPPLLKLRTLSINHNWLIEIDKFMDNLVEAAPNLRYLSTLHNAACPFFSNAKHHYYNYRIYIVSRLRKLTHLDSSPVTMEEWRHAACIIPSSTDNNNSQSSADMVEDFTLDEENNEI